MNARNKKGRGATKKRAQRATSNVFAMFDQVISSFATVYLKFAVSLFILMHCNVFTILLYIFLKVQFVNFLLEV